MTADLKLEECCPACKGTGKTAAQTCQTCQGKGTVLTEQGKKVLNYLRNSIKNSEH